MLNAKIFSIINLTVMKLSFMKRYLEEIEEISSYKVVSFDQLPMKLGILPVSLMSDAHLRPKEIFP